MSKTNLRTVSIPSVVGIGALRNVELGLGIAAQAREAGRATPHAIEIEGVSYLVGQGVADYAPPIERMDLARFADSAELRALLFTALAQLPGAKNVPLALNVGLPVEVVMDKAALSEVGRGMNQWLAGYHAFTLDGLPAAVNVATVRAKYSQPAGALFDYVYGDDLQVAHRLKNSWVLVVDVGMNTLDLVATGDKQQAVSGGARLGVRYACDALIESIERKHRVDDVTLAEADALLRAAVDGRATIQVHGTPMDVTAEARQAIDALAARVIRFVETRVGDGGRFDMLLTGGGSLMLRERLTRRWGHARMAGTDPVMSNARGFWKIGMTRDQLAPDGETVVGVDPGFGSIKLATG